MSSKFLLTNYGIFFFEFTWGLSWFVIMCIAQTQYKVLKRSAELTYNKYKSQSYGFWYQWFLENFEIDEAQVNFSSLQLQRSWTEMLFQLMGFKS